MVFCAAEKQLWCQWGCKLPLKIILKSICCLDKTKWLQWRIAQSLFWNPKIPDSPRDKRLFYWSTSSAEKETTSKSKNERIYKRKEIYLQSCCAHHSKNNNTVMSIKTNCDDWIKQCSRVFFFSVLILSGVSLCCHMDLIVITTVWSPRRLSLFLRLFTRRAASHSDASQCIFVLVLYV